MHRFLLNLLFLLLTFFAQWRLCRRVSVWRSGKLRVWTYVYLAGLLAGFLLGFAEIRRYLPFRSPWIAGISGAIFIWLFASSAAYGLYELLRRIRRHLPRLSFNPERRLLMNAAGSAVMSVPFAMVGYGALIQRTDFRVREIDIPVPHLPRDMEGLRLLQLSDIHLSPFLSEQELARVIDMANEVPAHIALVTGDLISTKGDPLDACLRQLSRLRADAGILGCLGNHERYAEAEDYATRQGARLGIRFLRSRTEQLHFGRHVLNIAGIDYQPTSMRGRYLRGAERMVVPGAVNVLLSHNPDVFPVAARKGYDLTISGHTHGGQVAIEILDQSINPARFLTPFVYGLYRVPRGGVRASAYVTRGIGTIGIPARIGAPPEIAVLRLRKA